MFFIQAPRSRATCKQFKFWEPNILATQIVRRTYMSTPRFIAQDDAPIVVTLALICLFIYFVATTISLSG